MLADQRVEGVAPTATASSFVFTARDVSFWAAGAEGAVAVGVGSTYRAIGRKAVEVCLLEEGREGERGRLRGCGLGQEL